MSYHLLSEVKTVSDLRELQRNFAELIRRPLLKGYIMKRDVRTNVIALPNKTLTAHERIEIYAQQYWWKIQQAFDDDFETVRKMLESNHYLSLRDEYLQKFPSISFTLRNLGKRFPLYVKKYAFNEKHEDFKICVYEAARYDWARIEASDGRAYKSIQVGDIEKKNFLNKLLYLQPHVQLLSLTRPVHKLLKSADTERFELLSNVLVKNTSRKLDRKPATVREYIQKSRTFLAVHRFQEKVFVKELTKFEYTFCRAFQRGISLNAVEREHFLSNSRIAEEKNIENVFKMLMSLKWLTLTAKKSYI
jgi:hypothetical protein